MDYLKRRELDSEARLKLDKLSGGQQQKSSAQHNYHG